MLAQYCTMVTMVKLFNNNYSLSLAEVWKKRETGFSHLGGGGGGGGGGGQGACIGHVLSDVHLLPPRQLAARPPHTCSMLYDSWHLKLYEVNCYCLIKVLLLHLVVADTWQPNVRRILNSQGYGLTQQPFTRLLINSAAISDLGFPISLDL